MWLHRAPKFLQLHIMYREDLARRIYQINGPDVEPWTPMALRAKSKLSPSSLTLTKEKIILLRMCPKGEIPLNFSGPELTNVYKGENHSPAYASQRWDSELSAEHNSTGENRPNQEFYLMYYIKADWYDALKHINVGPWTVRSVKHMIRLKCPFCPYQLSGTSI